MLYIYTKVAGLEVLSLQSSGTQSGSDSMRTAVDHVQDAWTLVAPLLWWPILVLTAGVLPRRIEEVLDGNCPATAG